MRSSWFMGLPLVLVSMVAASTSAPSAPNTQVKPQEVTQRAVEVRQQRHADVDFHVVDVDLRKAEVRLVRQSASGKRLSTFPALEAAMKAEGRPLLAATNAGIFKRDLFDRPVPEGLFVQEGEALAPLNREDGEGNFYWKPNGVFFIRDGAAGIVASDRFQSEGVRQATQSGPLLFGPEGVHAGFDRSASGKALRSAVGVDARNPHRVVIVLARDPSRFQTLAEFMRDVLGCTSALYLDGVISQLWTPEARGDGTAAPSDYAGFLTVTARLNRPSSSP